MASGATKQLRGSDVSQAILVMLETDLEVRDEMIGQVVPAVVELADVGPQDSAPTVGIRSA
jgi:hypothetical protein